MAQPYFSSQTIFSFSGTPARIVLAVAASNASYLYVLGAANTTGFTGLYKCTDAGVANPSFNVQSSSPDILSYNATGSGGANKQVFDLVLIVHPQNPERIFAGGLIYGRVRMGEQTGLSGATGHHSNRQQTLSLRFSPT